MYEPEKMQFATNQIHAARPERTGPAPLQTPIYQTSTFVFESTRQGAARFALEEDGYIYTRLHNPTADEVAARIACLEEGEAGMLTSSGMSAILAVLWTFLKSGDHILSDCSLYGCTYALFTEGLPRFGVEVTFADFTDPEAVRSAMRSDTKFVYCETASNPDLKVVDIREVSRIVKSVNPDVKFMVDNTFASPYLVKPLTLGADIVVHSATKYLNGHGDVIAGAIITRDEWIRAIIPCGHKYMTGGCIGPFDAYLLGRGLRTLDIRMERHCANAMKIATFLEGHPAVRKVNYPGLASHPQHALACREFLHGGFGGVISFETVFDKARTSEMVNSLRLCTLTVSLGDTNTLIEHPASMTHNTYTIEALAEIGISESLLRLAVGLEDPDDIIRDLKRELDRAAQDMK
ncbi:MAG: aminotransferase class I/II-fold pyridoxal phosphate-dependent enzyme [Clostridia bacterium]|nr:aminotransferase class I/II-fold pyridoxal phosphate-dependent enzyme [Clostridia bacterium]